MDETSIRIVAAPPGTTPHFEVEAVVIEDDTYLVLGADPVAKASNESARESLSRATAAQALEPGTVVVKSGDPLRLHAVVHDLSREPSWTEEWVASALKEVVRSADEREIRSLSMPLLGTLYGTLNPRKCVELIRDALAQTTLNYLANIWIVTPPDTLNGIRDSLRTLGAELAD